MTYIPAPLRRLAFQRAAAQCEYCMMREDDCYLPHQVDLVYAEKHGGSPVEGNLCLICVPCSRYKSGDLSSLDAQSSELVQLFNPRRDGWGEHFRLDGALIEPLTAKARATVRLLRLNDSRRVTERAALIGLSRYP